MGSFIAIGLLVLAGALFISVQREWISEPTLGKLANVAGVVALIAGAFVFIVPPPSAEPSPNVSNGEQQNSSINNNPTATPSGPEPLKIGEAAFYNRLVEKQDFPIGQDENGRSWYGDGGYNILALDTKSWWMWPLPDKQFKDMIVEVDVTPITKGSITGYVLAVGWSKGDNYHAFAVKQNGTCGFGKLTKNLGKMIYNLNCPYPVENQKVLVRLEVSHETQDNEDTCMRAFIEKQYIGKRCFTDYKGGLIGLGTYNGGQEGSGVEAQVRFNNLIIWNLSKQ